MHDMSTPLLSATVFAAVDAMAWLFNCFRGLSTNNFESVPTGALQGLTSLLEL